jgi:dTDP-4-dehydrorhamnose reductase
LKGGGTAHRRCRVPRTVVVIGSTGQLGSDCVAAFADQHVVGLSHADVDIGDADGLRAALGGLAPAIVVNTAAFLDVPRCETEVAKAFALNAIAPRTLAAICRELGARLVHVSTDYVFDGAGQVPYVETDRAMPLSVYGVSKLAGEHGVLNDGGDHQVVRSSGLYGLRPCRAKGGNFVDAITAAAASKPEVRVVTDEICTPTFTADLAAQLRVLALEGGPGLYHATNQGSCSWYDFARAVFDLSGITTPLRTASVRDFPATVRRPPYSVLENAALGRAGLDRMRSWREAVADYMALRTSAART